MEQFARLLFFRGEAGQLAVEAVDAGIDRIAFEDVGRDQALEVGLFADALIEIALLDALDLVLAGLQGGEGLQDVVFLLGEASGSAGEDQRGIELLVMGDLPLDGAESHADEDVLVDFDVVLGFLDVDVFRGIGEVLLPFP